MNVLIFKLNSDGGKACSRVNEHLTKVYTLYGIVPPTVPYSFPSCLSRETGSAISVGTMA